MVYTRPTQPISVQMSNRLYHGEVSGAEDALQTLVRGLESEVEETRQWNASLDPNDPEEARYRWDETAFDPYLAAAKEALSLWTQEQQAMKQRVIEQLRARGTGEATTIADALEADAWDALAW